MYRQDFTIRRVRELRPKSEVHRWELMLYDGAPVELTLSASFSKTHDGIALEMGAHYTAMRGQILRPLLDYTIEATFATDGAGDVAVVDGDELAVDPKALAMMLSVGVGALRGMAALRTEGSVLERYPVPVVHIADIIRRLEAAQAGADVPVIRVTFEAPDK